MYLQLTQSLKVMQILHQLALVKITKCICKAYMHSAIARHACKHALLVQMIAQSSAFFEERIQLQNIQLQVALSSDSSQV